jgi:hypothetical protein
MATHQWATLIVCVFVAIPYGLSQARVSLTAPVTQSGIQQSVSDGRRDFCHRQQTVAASLSIVLG